MTMIVPFRTSPPHGLLLGHSLPSPKSAPEPIWDDGSEGHLITVGPTGSGKGISCVIPSLLTWAGPVIVIDPRGEIAAVTAERREKMGHTVHVLDPFEITTGLPLARLNPLDFARRGTRTFEDDLAVIGDLLLYNASIRHDPFWDERATSLIIDVISNLTIDRPYTPPTFDAVQKLIEDYEEPTYGQGLAAKKSIAGAGPLLANKYGSGRTRTSIFTTASSHLGFVKSMAMQEVLANSTISLDDITDGAPLTIYLVLPPDKLLSHGKLLRLWLGVMLGAIGRRRTRPRYSTLIMVDEAAQLGELNALRSALTLMRGYGCRVWTIWQDLSQLRAIYSSDWESILNNSATQIFFRPATPSAQRQLEEYLGAASPRRLSGLKQADALLCRDGLVSVITRTDYRSDPLIRHLASPNPFHAGSGGELAWLTPPAPAPLHPKSNL